MHLLFLSSFLCIKMQKLLAQGMLKQFAGECKQIEKLNETYLKSKFDWNSMSLSKERRNNVRQRMRLNHFLKESRKYAYYFGLG